MDHLLPRSRGGTHEWHNIVLMCAEHNNVKGDRTIEEIGWSLKSTPVAPSYEGFYLDRTQILPQWRPWLGRLANGEQRAS